MSKYNSYMLLLLATILFACNHNTTEESKKPRERAVPLAFDFYSTIPPYREDFAAAFLKSYNTISMNTARENHEDSARVMVDEDSMAVNKKVPLYEHISFFPVFNKDTLENAYYGSLDKKSDRAHAATIDFNHNFILIVAHSPTGYLYQDVLSEPPVQGDTLRLSLSSDSIAAGNSNPAGTLWHTGVYKLQKRKYQVLGVDYNGHTRFFKLK